MKKLSIIIPFLNEQGTLGELLDKVVSVPLHGYIKEIIIVNDGSTDNSDSIIQSFIKNHKSLEIHYLLNEKNRWKGFSIKRGFEKATGDYMIIQDADLEYDPADYQKLLDYAQKKDLDVTYGSRTLWYFSYGFNYSTIWFLFWWLVVSALTSLLALHIVTDEPTCYKLFSKRVQKYLGVPEENGFEREPAITVLLLRKWFRYGEKPIKYYPRKIIHGKKIKLKDGFIALKTLWKWRWKKI